MRIPALILLLWVAAIGGSALAAPPGPVEPEDEIAGQFRRAYDQLKNGNAPRNEKALLKMGDAAGPAFDRKKETSRAENLSELERIDKDVKAKRAEQKRKRQQQRSQQAQKQPVRRKPEPAPSEPARDAADENPIVDPESVPREVEFHPGTKTPLAKPSAPPAESPDPTDRPSPVASPVEGVEELQFPGRKP